MKESERLGEGERDEGKEREVRKKKLEGEGEGGRQGGKKNERKMTEVLGWKERKGEGK